MLEDLDLLFLFFFFLKLFPILIEEVDNDDDELLIIVESKLEIMSFRISKYESWFIISFSKPHTSRFILCSLRLNLESSTYFKVFKHSSDCVIMEQNA